MNIFDTLMSLVSGIGTAKDKFTSLQYTYQPLTRLDLENAYRGDWVARKAIDIPPYDEVKNWRDWQATKDQIEVLEEEEKRLQLQRKIFRARILARLHGGSAIYIGTADGNLSLPLNPERVGQGGILYLHVLTRWELSATEIDRDVTSEWYGEPEMWDVANQTSGQLRIHPSRIIKFVGNPVPDPTLAAEPWWGDSVLDAVDTAIKQCGLTFQGVATMISEAKLDIISIPGMMNNMSDKNYVDKLTKRFTLANQLKSMVNALVLDENETFSTKQLSFTTLPDIMDRYLQAVSGAVDIPATRLLGQSPQGMNSTGDGDYKNYLDRISAGQSLDLQPAINRLDECLIRSALGSRDPSIYYEWAPLWLMSEKDKATVSKTKADTSKIYFDMGVIPGDAFAKSIVNQIIEDGIYPGIEKAIEESAIEVGEDQIGQEEELASAGLPPGASPEEEIVGAADPLPPTDEQKRVADSRPMTLYIRRDVLNAEEIRAWAVDQGITDIKSDLHCTIVYSRQKIDWMTVPDAWTGDKLEIIGGPRVMDRFGDLGEAIALLFRNWELMSRHGQIVNEAGASHDFGEYQPHITLSTTARNVIDDIKPYQGKIVLGPEVWEEIKGDA